MFEGSPCLQQKKNRGQTLPPNAYNMDLGSSIRSNVSNFNSPAHEEKIEEEEDPNAGIELLECRENANDTPEMEGNSRVCRRVKSIWLLWFFMCRSEMQI